MTYENHKLSVKKKKKKYQHDLQFLNGDFFFNPLTYKE